MEKEETKKKKGLNAPFKLRIRDRNEDGTGASDPTEVALHPSSVNAKATCAGDFSSPYLIYHEKVRTTRVYVRDCSPVSPYALILFGGVLSSQPGVRPPPPPVSKKHRHRPPPPPPPPKDGILVIDGWIRFTVSRARARARARTRI